MQKHHQSTTWDQIDKCIANLTISYNRYLNRIVKSGSNDSLCIQTLAIGTFLANLMLIFLDKNVFLFHNYRTTSIREPACI